MVWSVYAPTNRRYGALAGHYAGASAEATVGAGVGANALIGGSNRTVTLQPVSVQGQTGLNLAVGVAGSRSAAGALIGATPVARKASRPPPGAAAVFFASARALTCP